MGCLAQHCGRREHLNDDLHVVTLSKELLTAPPDVEALLLAELRRAPGAKVRGRVKSCSAADCFGPSLTRQS
jgi:hypothetical protein